MVAFAAIVLVGTLVGCDSADQRAAGTEQAGGSAEPPDGCEQRSEVSLCQTYDLSGAMTAQDKVTVIPTTGSLTDATEGLSCATLADNAAGFAFAPPDGEDAKIGGKAVAVYFAAEGYAGPGEYELGPGATIGEFVPAAEASPVIEVKADGSGKVTLDSFTSPDGQQVTGSIGWTCVEAT